MEFGHYRYRVRQIAFYTLSSWITLTTVLVVLMIWNAIDAVLLSNIIWSATAITVGILLGCITYFGFASAESEQDRDVENGEGNRHLRQAFEKAKVARQEN